MWHVNPPPGTLARRPRPAQRRQPSPWPRARKPAPMCRPDPRSTTGRGTSSTMASRLAPTASLVHGYDREPTVVTTELLEEWHHSVEFVDVGDHGAQRRSPACRVKPSSGSGTSRAARDGSKTGASRSTAGRRPRRQRHSPNWPSGRRYPSVRATRIRRSDSVATTAAPALLDDVLRGLRHPPWRQLDGQRPRRSRHGRSRGRRAPHEGATGVHLGAPEHLTHHERLVTLDSCDIDPFEIRRKLWVAENPVVKSRSRQRSQQTRRQWRRSR